MDQLYPSPEWRLRLSRFRSLFTEPGFRFFCAFLLVLAHTDGRLWITSVALSGLLDRHFTRFHGFLREGVWPLQQVRQKLWSECLSTCFKEPARLLVAIDDTVCAKYGRKFAGLGVHHNPMNKEHPRQLSRGHCFVCLALLAQPVRDHFAALFLGCALYVPKSVREAANAAIKKSRKSRKAEAVPAFATKLQLAAGLLEELPITPGMVVIAVCDGAYARKTFVQSVRKAERHVLSRLRSDTVFYDIPAEPEKQADGKRLVGRPRKYGQKYKASEWAASTLIENNVQGAQDAWRTVTLTLYGKRAIVQLKSRVVLQRTFGVRIRLVAVQWKQRPLVYLFSTDTDMTDEEIVRAYCARFAIETAFRDAKQSFGLSTYQVRGEQSILRLANLCLWAQTFLRLVYWNEKPQGMRYHNLYGDWRKPLGYLTLAQQKRLSQRAWIISKGSPNKERNTRNSGAGPINA